MTPDAVAQWDLNRMIADIYLRELTDVILSPMERLPSDQKMGKSQPIFQVWMAQLETDQFVNYDVVRTIAASMMVWDRAEATQQALGRMEFLLGTSRGCLLVIRLMMEVLCQKSIARAKEAELEEWTLWWGLRVQGFDAQKPTEYPFAASSGGCVMHHEAA